MWTIHVYFIVETDHLNESKCKHHPLLLIFKKNKCNVFQIRCKQWFKILTITAPDKERPLRIFLSIAYLNNILKKKRTPKAEYHKSCPAYCNCHLAWQFIWRLGLDWSRSFRLVKRASIVRATYCKQECHPRNCMRNIIWNNIFLRSDFLALLAFVFLVFAFLFFLLILVTKFHTGRVAF